MCDARGTEPSLDELFGDAAIRLLMRRDGVTESDVRALLCALKNARAVGLCETTWTPWRWGFGLPGDCGVRVRTSPQPQ